MAEIQISVLVGYDTFVDPRAPPAPFFTYVLRVTMATGYTMNATLIHPGGRIIVFTEKFLKFEKKVRGGLDNQEPKTFTKDRGEVAQVRHREPFSAISHRVFSGK